MAERLPQSFRTTQENIISGDFVDFATGKSFKEFFLGSSSGQNTLSNIAFYADSDSMFHLGTTTTANINTKQLDVDFDVKFAKTFVLEGEAVVNIPIAWSNDEDLSTMEAFAIAKIRKWDGSTETEIASTTGSAISFDTDGAVQKGFLNQTLLVDIPRTLFKAGDYLRLTIELWSKSNGTSDIQLALCADPKGRTTAYKNNSQKWDQGSAKVDLSSITGAFTNASILIPFRTGI